MKGDWLTTEDYLKLKAWARANLISFRDGVTLMVREDEERLQAEQGKSTE